MRIPLCTIACSEGHARKWARGAERGSRTAMSASATLLALLTLPILGDAQFNLRPVGIEPYSKWPCSDWTWQNCPQVIPEEG